MIVSLHITHASAGCVDGLNDIIPAVESEISKRIGTLDCVSEYVVVRTCNRLEVYVATLDNEAAERSLESIVRGNVPYSPDKKLSFVLKDKDSVKHLFRVACGLDSLIVGEDQIQHQIRDAYVKAKADGHANGTLATLFDHTLAVGKRVRSETALNKGAVSVGSAAVELAESKIGGLKGKNVTILGAGDMATVIAKNLVGKNPNAVFVSNRTFEHAKELADELGGMAITMSRMVEAIADSDLVLVATSAPHAVVKRETAEAAMADRGGRGLLMIDVSVPRNIAEDVREVDGVEVATMDSLQSIAMANVAKRTREISEAERIINAELRKMENIRKERIANDVIRSLGIKVAAIREEELTEARTRALVSHDDISKVLDDFSRALVNKILSEPMSNLREAARDGRIDICNTATVLFGLEEDNR
jgi:glutamyl-tRNA reductase